MSKKVPKYNWRIDHIDPNFGKSTYKCENATEYEIKKEIARLIRALRYGFCHIPGTEHPKDITVTKNGDLYGWCQAPFVGFVKIKARKTRSKRDFGKLIDIRTIDKNVPYAPYGERPCNHMNFTGYTGPTIKIYKV